MTSFSLITSVIYVFELLYKEMKDVNTSVSLLEDCFRESLDQAPQFSRQLTDNKHPFSSNTKPQLLFLSILITSALSLPPPPAFS